MNFADIISVNRIATHIECSSKKRSLEILSRLICESSDNINQNDVFDSLIARERLGSTALGKGIAIPHGRLKFGTQTLAAFIQLNKGIDFDAPDG
ncbi:MAG TPA: PTS sugar transporter subunit IIA, partial [Gammaproteobacteria bacterium]|nr:PTS sugar transporter subunit IIA [Gammaproteobacteria bacterium]